MSVHSLTELQHSNDRIGPWRIYVFDSAGKHRGGAWFRHKPQHEGEITAQEAQTRCIMAMTHYPDHKEVRVTDGGDMLVFHFDGRDVLHGFTFWTDILDSPKVKRVAAKWDEFRDAVRINDAPPRQLIEMRRAFFAGCEALLKIQMTAFDAATIEPTDDDLVVMDEIQSELLEFAQRVADGIA